MDSFNTRQVFNTLRKSVGLDQEDEVDDVSIMCAQFYIHWYA